jgi:hypothetical protein
MRLREGTAQEEKKRGKMHRNRAIHGGPVNWAMRVPVPASASVPEQRVS